MLPFCASPPAQLAPKHQSLPTRSTNDPLPIQPLNPKAFVQSANKSLSPTERVGLCQKGPGSLTIVCQVDNLGRIAAVTSVKLYKATGELPAPVVAKLSDGIRRDVRFPVITAAKGTPQSKYREVWMDYTLASFCE